MNVINLMNFFGILVEIVGVVILSTSDLFTIKLEVTESSIPGNPNLESYEAAKNGVTREISLEEAKYKELASNEDTNKGFTKFKLGIGFILLGMIFQLLAVATQIFCQLV